MFFPFRFSVLLTLSALGGVFFECRSRALTPTRRSDAISPDQIERDDVRA
jgi:hypothetical protein